MNSKIKIMQRNPLGMKNTNLGYEQSPNVHTNVDGSSMNSRRILKEQKHAIPASKLLFHDSFEVEHEVVTK